MQLTQNIPQFPISSNNVYTGDFEKRGGEHDISLKSEKMYN
jgi:hypothetical protein